MVKILFLTRSYYPNIGGVEKHIKKLADVLVKKDFEITVITEKSYSNDYQSEYSSAKSTGMGRVKVIEINVGQNEWLKKFRIWKELLRNFNLIKNADIIHAHDVYFWYILFRFIFPFKKSFVTFHGYEGNNLPTFKAYIMHKIAEVLSNGNICVGEFLKKWYHTKPNYITYGAIDNILSKKIRTVSAPKNRAIFIGRLEYETGILEYLKAVNLINEWETKFELDIYGTGSLEKEARRYVEIHNLPVHFKGNIFDIDSILKNYGFALVSRYLSILEAMAAKLPVFAHYNNEIKEDYLTMTPFGKYITVSNNYKELANAIKDYLEKDKQNTKQAFDWVKGETWEKMADIYLNLWNLKDHKK